MTHLATVRADALRLYEEPGLTMGEIEDLTGVSRRTISRWAREAGLPQRSRARPAIFTAKTREKAVRLYLEGLPMYKIEAATGACDTSIRTWVRDAGHPLRSTHTNARLDTHQVVELAEQHGPKRAAEILGCSVGSIRYHRERAVVLRVRERLARRKRR